MHWEEFGEKKQLDLEQRQMQTWAFQYAYTPSRYFIYTKKKLKYMNI